MRVLLYVTELVQAVSNGDFGRIEDILPDLACMFQGGGSNNYSSEILHFLFNLKEVWTPEFANIIRDNMLVNVSGLPGRWMGIDLNIEHLIRYLKSLFAAKGIYANWDQLGNLSASIAQLQKIKSQVTRSMQTTYQGSTHEECDASVLVWRMADKVEELQLQDLVTNLRTKLVPDLRASGHNKFELSSLATFNKKLMEMIKGKAISGGEDDTILLLPTGFGNTVLENF
ncbi:hypothetical protein H0H81_001033 [Sphagnurus paluster]|uniref:DUF6589 domain-containing protein n=1 Tax=Sphagnurus paluster TaxID=117069 RepID=A0A9P7GK60_9AGAR|nr:hypothetical protein H0H81_001033 [Sphagnurus paluster]